jgi:hypothetical protein
MEIVKKIPATAIEVELFLNSVRSKLPSDFIEFYLESNGAKLFDENRYFYLYPLDRIFEINEMYHQDGFALKYLIFGNNGGDAAIGVNMETGSIHELIYISSDDEIPTLLGKTMKEFIESDG